MSVLATAPTRTLDEALAEILDAAATGHGASCVVCGETATIVHLSAGPLLYECRACGSVLEDELQFESGPFPLD
jgi:hypothetical protein